MLSLLLLMLFVSNIFGFQAVRTLSTCPPRLGPLLYAMTDKTAAQQENKIHVASIPSQAASFFYSQKDFSSIGVDEAIMSGVLSALQLKRPSKIQALSFRDLYEGKHCILADQTGSGKTLAYLLPTVQRMLNLRKEGITAKEASSRSPLIVIITPTTELASQVSRQVKALANVLKFRTAAVTAATDMDSEQKKLRLGTEVLVSTPGRLQQLLKKKEVSFDHVQAIVLDEADVLFMDQSFPLQPIGEAAPPETQFIFATATLPDIVTDQIALEFPDIVYRMGPGLHRIAPNVEEVLVDCSGPANQEKSPTTAFENKRIALLRALEAMPDAERTLIFCNTIDQCRRVENSLIRIDRNQKLRRVLAYHGAVDVQQRQENMQEFSRGLLQQPAVLICTDRASRGMDFDRARVDHVILFDFPKEPSEYVRRVGRTGRAGHPGRATILVHGRQVPIATSVLSASINGKKIDPIPELGIYEK